MRDFDGETVIVTGSTKGIGNAIATSFAAEGANIVVNSRSSERAREAADAINDAGTGGVIGVGADTSDREAVDRMVERAVEEFGRVDVLVNNAGTTHIAPAEEFPADEWDRVVDVNLTGVFNCAQAAGRRMLDQDGTSAIVNLSSMAGGAGMPERTAYTATKAAVNNLTRSLAVEWARHGIYVNALSPGYVRTELVEETQSDADFDDSGITGRTPLGRLGSLEEMANCTKFLASRDNYVTGEVLNADGGWLAFGWLASETDWE
jgi:3-oxoacyl-[acyl-carrier protein] reductase